MSTIAIADVTYDTDSYDYEVGRIHKGMQLANHFENRNINIVENGQGQLAASQTVNAWNDAWDTLENENSIDLSITAVQYTFYLDDENDYDVVVSTDITYHPDDGNGRYYTVIDESGAERIIYWANVYSVEEETISLRDNRAALLEIERPHSTIREYSISDVHLGTFFELTDHWELIHSKVERAIQDSYDVGFEDGFAAGYDTGFAAAKSVVTNGD